MRCTSNELRESGITLGESVFDTEDVCICVDADDAPALEMGEDADASDLQRIGHVSGRKSGEPPLSAAAGTRRLGIRVRIYQT